MISSFRLKFGRQPGSTGEEITATPITVFVGPNNSGKSQVLRELESYCRRGEKDSLARVLDHVTFSRTVEEKLSESIERVQSPPGPGEALAVENVFVGSDHNRQQVSIELLRNSLLLPEANLHIYCRYFLTHLTLMLDGTSRINLVMDQTAGDLQRPATSSFRVLLADNAKRREVRRIVFEAFGQHFVLDPTNLGFLRIRLSAKAPKEEIEERGIHEAAVKFHAAAQPIALASDGVKAFTGIITELIAGDPSILLVDEPEAFLHPSLAYKLGQEVARAALMTEKRVFVSTHSPQFVMGCIQSSAPVNIIRLTYRDGIPTARTLPSSEILELMRHPLLRSTGLLSGLFYEFVIVTESDADRAFYQEINERLLQFDPEGGIANCLFINAQNKHTIPTLLAPLRKLGIPAAGIFDIDLLKEGGRNWRSVLESACIPELSFSALATQRASVMEAMDATKKNMKFEGGIAILAPAERQSAEDLLVQLKRYGVFIVPGGELESWMKDLGGKGHGPAWLIDVFQRMGEDPNDAQYVRPGQGDVWTFIRGIKSWLIDPQRRGIPD